MDNNLLRRRTRDSVAGFLIALWLLLFLPAFSLGYWEAWVYWILFSVSVIAIMLYFLKTDPEFIESRLAAGPVAEQERSQKIIQAFTAIAFILLSVIPGLDHRFGWSMIPVAGIAAGDLLAIAGFAIVFLAFRENRFSSAVIKVGEGQAVISTGPYAVVRHPMYAGASLILIATPFALGSLWGLVPALLAVAGMALRLLEEEKFLALNLPGYREYCRKTRYRLVPFIW